MHCGTQLSMRKMMICVLSVSFYLALSYVALILHYIYVCVCVYKYTRNAHLMHFNKALKLCTTNKLYPFNLNKSYLKAFPKKRIFFFSCVCVQCMLYLDNLFLIWKQNSDGIYVIILHTYLKKKRQLKNILNEKWNSVSQTGHYS